MSEREPIPPNDATPAVARERLTRCSYCGKSNRETGPWRFPGGRAYLCAPCVDRSAAIVCEGREQVVIPKPDSEGR